MQSPKAFFTTITPLLLRCLGLNGTFRARPPIGSIIVKNAFLLTLLLVGKSFAPAEYFRKLP